MLLCIIELCGVSAGAPAHVTASAAIPFRKGTMSVTLVNLSLGVGKPDSRPVPLGLLYLASSLKKNGVAVEIRNYEHRLGQRPFSAETFARFLSGSGSLIAISLLSNMIPVLLSGVALFKRENPAARIVVGGFGASSNPELLLRTCPGIDFIISGWGEVSLCDLVSALDGRAPLEAVAGLSFRREDGRIVHVPPAPPPAIGQLPPPAHRLVETRDRHTSLPVLTACGCPHRCAFCDIPGYHHFRTVYRDLDHVLDEIAEFQDLYRADAIKRLEDAGQPPRQEDLVVGIIDDTFCTRNDRVRLFCDKLSARGMAIKWRVSARVDEVTPELLDRMAEAGCDAVFFGIESGSDRVLKAIGKGFDAARALEVVELAARRIPTVTASFIWGLPMETMADFRETLLSMVTSRAVGARTQAHLWAPFPRSRLYGEFRDKLAFSRRFISDIAFESDFFFEDCEDLIRANPELCSCFYHYPHPDLEERQGRIRQLFGA